MARRKPLVQGSGQVEQLPNADYLNIGKLNIGPGVVIAAAATITIPNSSHILLNNPGGGTINVDIINGGSNGDIAVFRLAPGSGNVRVRKGNGNVSGSANRLLNNPEDILTMLGTGTGWIEIAWQG